MATSGQRFYDPATGAYTDMEDMAHGRWYPTNTILGDGRLMTIGGLTETGGTNATVEIYKVGVGWGNPVNVPFYASAVPPHGSTAKRYGFLFRAPPPSLSVRSRQRQLVRRDRDDELRRDAHFTVLGFVSLIPLKITMRLK